MTGIVAKYNLICFVVLCSLTSQAQIGTYADSLQIKTYVTIHYKNQLPSNIVVNKIFCDYCNDNQKKHLKQRAWQLAYFERYNPENVLKNGKRRLTFLIRMARKDLIRLREEE